MRHYLGNTQIFEYKVRELGASPAKTHAVLHYQVSCFKIRLLIAGRLPGFLKFFCLYNQSGMMVLFVVLYTMCASLYI